jgi:hypothetical protein
MTPSLMAKLCLGAVAGLKFCTSGKTTCLKSSHSKKVDVQVGMVYIAGPRSSAFTQVYLDPAMLPREHLEKLLGEKNTLEAWQRFFGAIQEQLLGLAPIASDEFESFKARAVSNISIGVTPREKIARYADDHEGGSPWEPSNMVAKLSPLRSSLLEDIDSESLIAAQMDKLLVACKETMTKFEKMHLAVREDVDRLEAAIHEISLRTGKNPGLSDTPLLSAWEGVALVHASMQEALAVAGALHSEMAASRRRIEEVEAYTLKANASFSQLNKQMGQQGQLLNLLATENQRLQATLQTHPPAQPPVSAAGIVPSLAGDIRLSEMENQIKMLEARYCKRRFPLRRLQRSHLGPLWVALWLNSESCK